METKVELINGKYYHVNQNCTRGVLIGNHDALLEYVSSIINDLNELREVVLMFSKKANAVENHLQKKQDLELENNKLKSEINELRSKIKDLYKLNESLIKWRNIIFKSIRKTNMLMLDINENTVKVLDEHLLDLKNIITASKNLTDDEYLKRFPELEKDKYRIVMSKEDEEKNNDLNDKLLREYEVKMLREDWVKSLNNKLLNSMK